MTIRLKPFKASCDVVDIAKPTGIQYPMLGSLKKDGHRLFIIEGELLTAAMKPYPNRHLPVYLKELVRKSKLDGIVFDGELYDHTKPFTWHSSTFRSQTAIVPPTTKVSLIDVIPYSMWTDSKLLAVVPFQDRLTDIYDYRDFPGVEYLAQVKLRGDKMTLRMYEKALREGYEGLMLRNPLRGYKHGRTSVNENWLLKLKEFVWYDGVIVDITTGKALNEDAEIRQSPVGLLARSHRKADRHESDLMGAFIVRLENGTTTKIGTWKGLSHEMRREYLHNKEKYIGRWVRFKGQRVGVKDRPRIPKGLEFRDDK